MTRKNYVTCSAMSRIMKCHASAVLPWIKDSGDFSKVGSAGHGCLEFRAAKRAEGLSPEDAYQASLEHVNEQAIKFALNSIETAQVFNAVRGFKWCAPPDSMVETSFWMDRSMDARQLEKAKAAPGNYQLPNEAWVAGTADVIYPASEDTLWVIDYKFGEDKNVSPIDHNAQLWTLAHMAGYALKFKKVMPAIVFIRPGHEEGVWETPDGGPFEIERGKMWQFGVKLQEAALRIDRLRERYDAGDGIVDGFCHGTHCTYCPGSWMCDYHLGIVRGLLGKENLHREKKLRAPLQPDEARALAESLTSMGRAVTVAKELLESYVNDNGPIDLGNGNAWGPVKVEKDMVYPSRRTYDVLWEEFGEGTWNLMKVSASAIYEECKNVALKTGQKVTHVNKKVITELQASACFLKTEQVHYKEHRPDIEVTGPSAEEG